MSFAAGATAVIVGSSLFQGRRPDLAFAGTVADAVGADRVIAAVDSRGATSSVRAGATRHR